MDYYERSQLPILSFEEETTVVDRARVRQALCEKPCNLVFIEVQNKLYGIISSGDVARAGRGQIPVNRNVTALKEKQFMQAREIFFERKNIREIPILDQEGRLTGMCSRSDDLLYLEYARSWEGNRYAHSFFQTVKAARIVRPPKGDLRRQKLVDRWTAELKKRGVACNLIDLQDVLQPLQETTPILLVDEQMNVGAKTIIEFFDEIPFNFDVIVTFRKFEQQAAEHAYDNLIGKLVSSGIKVYNFYFSEDESTEGRRRLWENMRGWEQKQEANYFAPYVSKSYAPGFFGELNVGDYAAEVGRLPFAAETNSVFTQMKDVHTRYLNIENGERVTVGQPVEAERTIYFFGPCIMIGGFVEDKHTIESFIQERFNREGYSCKVVNCGCFETPFHEMLRIAATPMKPGDVVVLFLGNQFFADAETVDLTEILDRHDVPSEWLMNAPVHCNYKVHKIYADELFDRMVRDGALTSEVSQEKRKTMLDNDLAVNSLYLDLHFDGYKPKEGEKIGGINFHGNPFTLGHRYLFEYASKHADRIFALQTEDEVGLLSFAERFAMAIEGTKDLPNVTIVPGGAFQGSRYDFPVYFVKVDPVSMSERSALHLQIYVEVVAKRLGISCRFIGDERHNEQMSAFNELMKEMLPRNGVDVVEIPRAQAGGRSISASLARRAAADGDRETLLANLPESTLKFLVDIDDYAKEQSREN